MQVHPAGIHRRKPKAGAIPPQLGRAFADPVLKAFEIIDKGNADLGIQPTAAQPHWVPEAVPDLSFHSTGVGQKAGNPLLLIGHLRMICNTVTLLVLLLLLLLLSLCLKGKTA